MKCFSSVATAKTKNNNWHLQSFRFINNLQRFSLFLLHLTFKTEFITLRVYKNASNLWVQYNIILFRLSHYLGVGISLIIGGVDRRVQDFNANHPFLYSIQGINEIFFLGRYGTANENI